MSNTYAYEGKTIPYRNIDKDKFRKTKLPRHERKETDNELKLSKRQKRALLISVILVGAVFLIYLVVNAYLASLIYDNNSLRKDNFKLKTEVETMEYAVEKASNLGSIETKAITKLKMKFPEGSQFVEIRNGQNTTVPAMADVNSQI